MRGNAPDRASANEGSSGVTVADASSSVAEANDIAMSLVSAIPGRSGWHPCDELDDVLSDVVLDDAVPHECAVCSYLECLCRDQNILIIF